MTEKLIIKNFAGIKELELELRRINVLIGAQATGKSICAKLLYFFKDFFQSILPTADSVFDAGQMEKQYLDERLLSDFERYFPSPCLGDGAFSVRYEIGDLSIEVVRGGGRKGKNRIEYSDYFFQDLAQRWKSLGEVPVDRSAVEDMNRAAAVFAAGEKSLDTMSRRFGFPVASHPMFVPAGRSFFAQLQRSIFSYLKSNTVDPFLSTFGMQYEPIRRRGALIPTGMMEDERAGQLVDALVQGILCGKHVIDNNEDFLDLPDGRRVAIANSSSGQQETLPLVVILGRFPFMPGWKRGHTIIIEEPEAHLFPTAQRKIVELMATVFNTSPTPLQFFITTHSPYILTAFNNLLQAGSLEKRLPKRQLPKLRRIVPADQAIDPDIFRTYSLGGGTAKDIFRKDTGLISADVIDDVSDDLSIQFDSLLEMEPIDADLR